MKKQPYFAVTIVTALLLSTAGIATPTVSVDEIRARQDRTGYVNVLDFGAKGDGKTDDTGAIQAAIDFVAEQGAGKVFFPYRKDGYRIASPARENVNGKPCRGQLYIPPGAGKNIALEGAFPCRMLYSYQVRPKNCAATFSPTRFGNMPRSNTFLFSDWNAPEVRDAAERPYAVLATVEGTSCAGRFSISQVSLANLEIRVHLHKEKMFPTESACNLQNAGRIHVSDCQFCLDDNIGDTESGKELQPNPCHTVGFMASGDQNDNNVLRNVAVQGFRYGFVFGEHVQADYLYVHNTEEGIVFHDSSHLSMIGHVVAQHNRKIVTTSRGILFGHRPGRCFVIINGIDYEPGFNTLPVVSRMTHGIYDPENRLYGLVRHHAGFGGEAFSVKGGRNLRIENIDTLGLKDRQTAPITAK